MRVKTFVDVHYRGLYVLLQNCCIIVLNNSQARLQCQDVGYQLLIGISYTHNANVMLTVRQVNIVFLNFGSFRSLNSDSTRRPIWTQLSKAKLEA